MEVDYQGFCLAFGRRVRQLRKERGWSNRDMLLKHGIDDSQWRGWERGGGMTIESLLRIAAIFGLSLSQLLDGLGDAPQASVAQVNAKLTKAAAKNKPN